MTVFSLLSFVAWFRKMRETRLFIFTDHPNYFHPFLRGIEIEYHLLDHHQLEEMLDGSTYVHLRKVAVIERIQRQHPSEPLVFLDSDTFMKHDPHAWLMNLTYGKTFMHTPEYTFHEALHLYASFGQERYPQAFLRLIQNKDFRINGEQVRFHRHQACWNSGVLGLPAEISSFLPDVYCLAVEIFEATHWNTSEQIAFSLVLQSKTQILPCDQFVVHYWSARLKSFMEEQLLSLLDAGFSEIDLPQKLVLARKWAKKYADLIPLEQSKERAINAFLGMNILSGCKHALRVLIRSPFNISFLEELVAIRKKQNL